MLWSSISNFSLCHHFYNVNTCSGSSLANPGSAPACLHSELHFGVFCCFFSVIKIFTVDSGCTTVPVVTAFLPQHDKISKGFNTPPALLNPWLSLAHAFSQQSPVAAHWQLPGCSQGLMVFVGYHDRSQWLLKEMGEVKLCICLP